MDTEMQVLNHAIQIYGDIIKTQSQQIEKLELRVECLEESNKQLVITLNELIDKLSGAMQEEKGESQE